MERLLISLTVEVILSLEPIQTLTTYADPGSRNWEVDETGREVAIGKIKFSYHRAVTKQCIGQGRKAQRRGEGGEVGE